MSYLYKIIPFNVRHGNCGGSLIQFQAGDSDTNALPFGIGKVLIMSDIKPDDVRGMHAHHETEEILVALSGGCTVEMDDGCGQNASVRLSSSEVRAEAKRRQAGGHDSNAVITQASDVSNLISDLRPPTSEKAALLLYPHVWRVMRDFEPDTMLMVIANIKYDEADYIRNRVEFERISKSWGRLGRAL